MVDLYRDIDWSDTIKENREKFSDFDEMLRKECQAVQDTEDFKTENHRVPVPNLSFSNYIILTGAPVVDIEQKFKIVG